MLLPLENFVGEARQGSLMSRDVLTSTIKLGNRRNKSFVGGRAVPLYMSIKFPVVPHSYCSTMRGKQTSEDVVHDCVHLTPIYWKNSYSGWNRVDSTAPTEVTWHKPPSIKTLSTVGYPRFSTCYQSLERPVDVTYTSKSQELDPWEIPKIIWPSLG